jgi:hypothetical protein
VKPVTAVRITDKYLLKRIESLREQNGESTATTTARRLLVERLAQLELIGDQPGSSDRRRKQPA